MVFKQTVKKLLNTIGYDIRKTRVVNQSLPGYGTFKSYYEIAQPFTLHSADRCYVLYTLALQSLNLDGQWYEAGVYKGGTAILLAMLLIEKARHKKTSLHLFDTFKGLPETDSQIDLFKKADFKDTSLEAVSSRIRILISDFSVVEFFKGVIPATFSNLESHHISFAHIDAAIYQSVIDCCNFIYPRMQNGGFMVFGDYGFATSPGSRKAVNEFFIDKYEVPFVLPTGQAVVFRAKYGN